MGNSAFKTGGRMLAIPYLRRHHDRAEKAILLVIVIIGVFGFMLWMSPDIQAVQP